MKILILLLLSLSSLNLNLDFNDTINQAIINSTTQEFSIVCIGDIMCHNPQLIAAKKGDIYDFNSNYEYIMPILSSADLSIANLETTLTDKKNYSSFPCFKSPIELVKALKNNGIDIVTTSNNHSLDGGKNGVEFTIDALDNIELKHVGTCRETEKNLPLIVNIKNIKFGIISSTYGTNGLYLEQDCKHMVNINNSDAIVENIQYLKANKVDGILYFIHWGNEYQRNFNKEQYKTAKNAFENGVNWIIGSHPHVIQEAEGLENTNNYVLYSLGNAISNQRWRYSDTGLLAKLYFEKPLSKNLKLKKVEYHPFWVDKYDENGNIDYKILPILENELPNIERISSQDKIKITQARSDFRELYPNDILFFK